MGNNPLAGTTDATTGYTLPIVIAVPLGVKIGYLLRYAMFSALAGAVLVSLVGKGLAFPLAVGLIGFCLFSWRRVALQRVVLNETQLEAQGTTPQTISYRDIQKVGYYYTFTAGRGGGMARSWLELYTAAPQPILIPIISFSNRDAFTILQVLLRKNPEIQIGDNLAQAITTGVFPTKEAIMTFSPLVIQDTHFAKSPGRFLMPDAIRSENYGFLVVFEFLQLGVVQLAG